MEYTYYHLLDQMNVDFVLLCDALEVACTSWAEWRYHDNPSFYHMYLMGGEI